MQDHFLGLKSNLELDPTLAESISTRHNALRTYLENNYPEFKSSKLIGSFQRQTKIRPGLDNKLDIDIIVVVGEFHNWVTTGGITPQDARRKLHLTVDESARYGAMNPVQDPPTIKLTYRDNVEVELVPAYVDMIGRDSLGTPLGFRGRGYWVAKSGGWEMADYDHEADWISAQNIGSGGYLIPTIKMLKSIRRVYFPELGSFPLEIIAANIIPVAVTAKQVSGRPIYYADLILEFFEAAPAKIVMPIQIPGSKSTPIILDSLIIQLLTNRFNLISCYIRSISASTAHAKRVSAWRELCGEHFPVTITQ